MTRMLERAPNLAILYPRALVKRGGGHELPDTRLGLRDVAVERERLTEYHRVCGFGPSDTLPGTYPQVLAFPLAIALMSERAFPFPLPGIVHIGNTITQRRPIAATERLTFEVRTGNLRPHRRGRQFDVVTEARVGDEPVWDSTATYLRRGAGTGAAAPEPGEVLPTTAVWRVPGNVGRRYARASGDRNPIHLHPLTAKLFGFPRAIAHGMWMKARCLAAIEGRLPEAWTAEVRFAKPLLLPSTVDFGVRGRDFSVASGGRPHLTGRAVPAPGNATPHPG
ncbi:acyl dehydratase [Cryptosporangium arvum DSM 44712]|uniref:Acyl dehydratase n=2 Tax=Cryptosporangium TaxID=65502 RepID=A0A010YJ05_9ACTN|nr:MaoC/PaaZ C-terminal domain-containing protein [Cryptosporangium arvum]EXG80210.1 acyl dehydratase [Cryptosporangium arvum DSM 44712]